MNPWPGFPARRPLWEMEGNPGLAKAPHHGVEIVEITQILINITFEILRFDFFDGDELLSFLVLGGFRREIFGDSLVAFAAFHFKTY